jgi:hypothetical protein
MPMAKYRIRNHKNNSQKQSIQTYTHIQTKPKQDIKNKNKGPQRNKGNNKK